MMPLRCARLLTFSLLRGISWVHTSSGCLLTFAALNPAPHPRFVGGVPGAGGTGYIPTAVSAVSTNCCTFCSAADGSSPSSALSSRRTSWYADSASPRRPER